MLSFLSDMADKKGKEAWKGKWQSYLFQYSSDNIWNLVFQEGNFLK